jgi:hypothetical protein
MEKELRIGWCEKDITPAKPVSLLGQFYKRVSEYVHSPITVTVLAVENGEDQLVLGSCDLCSVTADVMETVRERLEGKCDGLNLSKIILGATHIHTGPIFDLKPQEDLFGLQTAARYLPEHLRPLAEKYTDGMMTPYEYGVFLVNRIAEAIEEAWNNRKPGGYAPGFARAVVGHCRRTTYSDGTAKMYGRTDTENFVSLEGGNDSGIELMYIFDRQEQLTGIVINVACPSQVIEHKNVISADYWGEVKRLLREKYGDHLYVLPQCSAAGDQSPRDLIRRFKNTHEADFYDFEGLIEIGKRISNAVIQEYDYAKNRITFDSVISHKVEMIDFPTRRVTEAEYLEAKKSFEAYVATRRNKRYAAGEISSLHGYAGIMRRYETQDENPYYRAEIHTARLGNLAFASNPFELFLDYGLQIKALSKADQTFIIQLANDSGSYLPTEKAEKGGHYSAVVASGKTGHEGGAILVNKTLQSINEMFTQQKKGVET